ncbi:hypothetical protein IAG42_00115 [Streptomyces xanthii]|uniref:Uncharacterized protein n=1 Tax=Streptomyces xanthii TaxID=2768069 RepID=A0A7H1B0B8_9ACTN|nr:hypothetical protein IAG42_00115 [Streptomyces xanthii]
MSTGSPAPTDALFAPLKIRSLELPNRIVMSPMTRERCPRGIPGPDVAAYYRRRVLHRPTDSWHPHGVVHARITMRHQTIPASREAESRCGRAGRCRLPGRERSLEDMAASVGAFTTGIVGDAGRKLRQSSLPGWCWRCSRT